MLVDPVPICDPCLHGRSNGFVRIDRSACADDVASSERSWKINLLAVHQELQGGDLCHLDQTLRLLLAGVMPEEGSHAVWLEKMLSRHTGVHCLQRPPAGRTHAWASQSGLSSGQSPDVRRLSSFGSHSPRHQRTALLDPVCPRGADISRIEDYADRLVHSVDSVSSAPRQTQAAQFVRGA